MCYTKKHELTSIIDFDAIKVYNKMHASFNIKVKWDIVRFKHKWKRLMKHFDSTKEKYSHLFKVVALMINFLHKCHQDFTFEIIRKYLDKLVEHGWDSNYLLSV